MTTPSLEIKLKRVNKIYHEGEVLSGLLLVSSRTDVSYQSIALYVDGTVSLSLSSKNVGVFEAFYNSVKPINLLHFTVEISKAGKLPNGKTEFPFEVPLKPRSSVKKLYETYQGVYINVSYTLKAEMKTSLLKKDLVEQTEFFIEYKPEVPSELSNTKCIDFVLQPDKLKVKDKNLVVPDFKVVGCMDNTVLSILKPYTGTRWKRKWLNQLTGSIPIENPVFDNHQTERTCWKLCNSITIPWSEDLFAQALLIFIFVVAIVTKLFLLPLPCEKAPVWFSVCFGVVGLTVQKIKVVHSHTPIRSIEVQLVRVETCGCAEGYSKDVTEIQNIQIADGDICRGIDIPVHMVFPRLFSCPTAQSTNFKIEFEVNLVIVFKDPKSTCVTENFQVFIGRF